MATERLSMRQIREILRQKWVVGCSHRQVTASLRVSLGTVTAVLRRATHAGLDWPQVEPLPDDALEARLRWPRSPGRSRLIRSSDHLHPPSQGHQSPSGSPHRGASDPSGGASRLGILGSLKKWGPARHFPS
jgi:hypothetical protein